MHSQAAIGPEASLKADSSHIYNLAYPSFNTMQRQQKPLKAVYELLQTVDIISANARTIIKEWSSEQNSDGHGLANGVPSGSPSSTATLPSHALFQAQKTILAAVGKITELVSEPPNRLLEVGTSYWEARCLCIAAERRIPDFLAERGGKCGVHAEDIAKEKGVEVKKLSKSHSAI